MNSLQAGRCVSRQFLTGLMVLGFCFATVVFAATGSVEIRSNGTDKPPRKPSPSLDSLPPPAAAGPLKILLIDDDNSSNNRSGDGELSRSDKIFRELVGAAVGGDAQAWSVVVVEMYKHGPTIDRLQGYNLVLWYTGDNYGGGSDHVSVLSVEDEKTVRAYLEGTGGSVVLVSPGFASVYGYATDWTQGPVPFLTEVAGVNGFHGLVQRFVEGAVKGYDGSTYLVQEKGHRADEKGPVEPQFSAVNPDGAAVVFTSSLDPVKTAKGAVPVAVAQPYGKGRFVYVGFSLENVLPEQLSAAFGVLLQSAGVGGSGPKVATSTVVPIAPIQPLVVNPIRTGPPIKGGTPTLGVPPVATMNSEPPPTTAPPVAPVIHSPPLPADRTDPIVLGALGPEPTIKAASMTEAVMKDIEFDNWGFEHGLTGWTATGTAFGHQPTFGDNVRTTRVLQKMEYAQGGVGGDYWKDQGYPNGYKGTRWIGTYENNTGDPGSTFGATQGDAPKGELVSPVFQVTQSRCYFLIGGGADAAVLKVELQTKQADGSWRSEAARTSFRNSELFYRESFDLVALKGKTARIRVIDNGAGNWGHINVDDFVFQEAPWEGITLTDPTSRRQYLVDEDYPVWGIADTHAHPAHDDGFGSKLVVGRADDPLSVTYSSQLCRANHSNFGAGLLNTIFIGGGDPHPFMDGWPDFVGFPRFNSRTHQQQHVEFLKRAWEGGLRLIAALAVNNMYLPSLAMGPGTNGAPYDDHEVTLRQIQDLKRIASSQSSWMEIAYTPKDARRIISEGKCAMVLGLELDNFGNFKVPSYNWNDGVNPSNSPLVSLTSSNADQLVGDRVNQYFNLGVRQVTPIHYISGTFGGAAVFRGQIALNQFAFNQSIDVKSGINRNIPYTLYADYSASMLAVMETPAQYLQKIHGTELRSTINANGMTEFGRILIRKLMDKGIILDSEHMGYDTKEDLFALASSRNYPVISSHTDPAGLGYNWLNGPTFFGGDAEENVRNYGTSNIRSLASEFNLADEHYQKIRDTGGTVGVFMLPYLKKPYQGYLGSVENNCAGSTKTWAQNYLYSVDKMDRRGIALASDRGMTDFIAPRFGPNAGYALAEEISLSLKRTERAQQRNAQRNGVKYDRPMSSFHIGWYHQYDGAAIDEHENDAWIAFAALEANVAADKIPLSYYPANLARISNFVKGFRATSESQLEQPFGFNGDSPFEQAATFCLKHNRQPNSLAAFAGYNFDQQNRVNYIHTAISRAWVAWTGKYGSNAPIRRYRTGNRDWDFNTDGMAHYGLMPDFLQDLRNIGVTPDNLSPLMRSAEDYLRAWEKSVKTSISPKSGT